MKRLCAAAILVAASVAGAGPAYADVCGYAGGPYIGGDGCTEIGRDVESVPTWWARRWWPTPRTPPARRLAAARRATPATACRTTPRVTPHASELAPNTAHRHRPIANFPASHPPDRAGFRGRK